MNEIKKNNIGENKSIFLRNFYKYSGTIIPFTLSILILIAIISIAIFIYVTNEESIKQLVTNTPPDETIIYIVSWILLLIISILSSFQIKEIIHESKEDINRKKANYIAIIIGLVLIIFMFKQPYLDKLLPATNTKTVLKYILMPSGAVSGWFIWYLKMINRYGEFFNVLLLTTVSGFCWYARLTAPEEIQLTAVAFLLGSLFRIAKDYMDKAHIKSPQIN